MRYVLRGDQLHDRLTELLKHHTSFDLATAWATCDKHLRALAEAECSGTKVRAIVGIAGNATHPDALEELNKITHGNLRIVPKGGRVFHPKLYLFGRRNGTVTGQVWIGSANFTKAGFGHHSTANEEIMLEVGPGARADELAAWFEERWNDYASNVPISEVICQYAEHWMPPHPDVRSFVFGSVSSRVGLLEDRPQTFDHYRQALSKCEGMLRAKNWNWGVLNPEHGSYMAAISGRRELLFGRAKWSKFKNESRRKLTGSYQRSDLEWWGLMGQMNRGKTWSALCERETEIREILESVRRAGNGAFPDIAINKMEKLTGEYVKHATVTLLLTLARPDRLLSVNGKSKDALGQLSGYDASALQTPDGYRNLLQWLYEQPWYADGPPVDEDLEPIWRFRAALVDAFVYER